jgi:hypothetical protein
MTEAERLALAVLLFFRGGPWTAAVRAEWRSLAGDVECTSKELCNLARRILDPNKEAGDG